MSYATIDDLRSQLGSAKSSADDPSWRAKMLHTLPEVKAVNDRAAFILEHVKGKRVLEFGASGPLHEAIKKAAATYKGVDREAGDRVIAYDLDEVSTAKLWLDLGDDDTLPDPLYDIIVCGELLEHLSNPGWFLMRLQRQYPRVPVLITVPNAFSAASQQWLKKGYEAVNRDHVAWYSPKTLSVLLERAGFTVADLYYYNGHGPTAEGLIVVAE